jgi:hypothetical protein
MMSQILDLNISELRLEKDIDGKKKCWESQQASDTAPKW